MKDNFLLNKGSNENIFYYTISNFDKYDFLKYCFTTRIGGVSQSPYNSLNLGLNTDDKPENVYDNYKIICDELNIEIEDLVFSDQVHSDKVLIIDESYKCQGKIFHKKLNNVDGLITNKSTIALVTLYADCVPLIILDPIKKVVGLSHAGWKGTVKKIGRKTIELIIKEYHSLPQDLLIGIGPSIGKCCYEVNEDVIKQFKKVFKNSDFIHKKNGKYFLDLWKANKNSLLEVGVKESNIIISEICTQCNNKLLFSHRGDKGNTGRMAAIIQLI